VPTPAGLLKLMIMDVSWLFAPEEFR
jgi:hypothetical protein